MTTLAERLKSCRDDLGLSQAELAKLAKLKNQSIIGSLETGYRKKSSHVPAIAAALNIEPLWLAEGRGPKRRSGVSPSSDTQTTSKDTQFTSQQMGGDMHNVVALRQPGSLPDADYIRFDHLSPQPRMGAGGAVTEPMRLVQHVDVLASWARNALGCANPDRVKVLTAMGDSMLPTIREHDLVFIDTGHAHLDNPGLYVIDVAGRLLLKRIKLMANGTVIISSDNTELYPESESYPIEEAEQTITICGRVLGWWTLRRH